MKRASRISVMVMGLRGLPNVPGGVETHAAELYPRLAALGMDVTVLGRRPYRPAGTPATWKGVKIEWLRCPRLQGVEAVVHTLLGVLHAGIRRPDVVHIHAVGPWLMVPLAKLLGLKVVVTHHGQDYMREKWNAPAKALLRLGERLGMGFADECIVISKPLLRHARAAYHREAVLIPNGVSEPQALPAPRLLAKYDLTPQRYVIQVSRLVPEKRQLDLITAFNAAQLPGWKLLLVGGAQGSEVYADQVRAAISGNPSIINTGFLSPPEVQELLVNAGIFVLPSSHEGLPISLLEAMKLGTPVIASDIEANRETGLDDDDFFPVGNVPALEHKLRLVASASEAERAQTAKRLTELCKQFDWEVIAEATMQVMNRVGRRPPQVAWQGGSRPASPQ